jgi:hypothetical protein
VPVSSIRCDGQRKPHLDGGPIVYAGVALGRQQGMMSAAAAARLSAPHQARGNIHIRGGFDSSKRSFSAAAAVGGSGQPG